MRITIPVCATFAGFLAAAHSAYAAKSITFEIKHPPALTSALAGRLVVPGQLTGDCAKEFGDLLFQDMRAHDVAMAAPNSPAGGAPTVVVSVNVTRCEGRQQQPILGEGLPAVHISRTDGWFAAEIHAVDSATGQEIASMAVHGHAQKENESQTSNPEWPAPSDLKNLAVLQGIGDAKRLYAPWTEKREIAFMDNKDCHLKQEFETAKSGDYEALVKEARANAEACGSGKGAMEAWYDFGVASFISHHYDDAAAAFQKAADLNGAKLVGGLLDESRKEAAILKAQQSKAAAVAPAAPVQTGMLMTNDLVIKLVDGNIAEAEILKMIANQPGRFSLAPADIAKLKAAGVSDAIIAAMRNKK